MHQVMLGNEEWCMWTGRSRRQDEALWGGRSVTLKCYLRLLRSEPRTSVLTADIFKDEYALTCQQERATEDIRGAQRHSKGTGATLYHLLHKGWTTFPGFRRERPVDPASTDSYDWISQSPHSPLKGPSCVSRAF